MNAAFDVLVRNTSEVVTCDGDSTSAEEALGLVSRGAIGITAGRIAWLGHETALPDGAVSDATRVIDALGGFVGPGFVDCHTHVVFKGERSDELELRCQGKSYLEIAAAGGGIARTVAATRAASEDELVSLALPRLQRLLEFGVTTAEVKSGYGLSLDDELKLLRAIHAAGKQSPITLLATFLGLHAVPKGVDREAYLSLCIDELLPQVAREKLASACDIFVEQAAFSHDDARRLARKAHELGVPLRMHVDQLTANGGAQLAAELGAVSADHLEQISADGIAALAKSNTVAVLAPTSTIFAKARPFAPGRALRDAGVAVAVCTNCNPGSSMSENVSLALGLACVENGLRPAEAYLGFTRIAARVLGLDMSAGRIRVGVPADVVVFSADNYRALPYHFAMNQARVVLKAGQVVSGS